MTRSDKSPAPDDLTETERQVLVNYFRTIYRMNIIRANMYIDRLIGFCERRQRKTAQRGQE